MTMKRSVVTAAILGAAAFSGSAMAGVTGNVGAVSEYMFRGLSQGTGAAVQGGVDYSADSGLYAGLWGSNIGWGPGGSETDVYGGFSGEAGGVGYDVGAIFYGYPEQKESDYKNTSGFDSANTYELYAGASMAGAGLKVYYSPNYFGLNKKDGKNMPSWYVNASYGYSISDSLTASAAIGYTKLSDDGQLTNSKGNATSHYIDYNVSLSKDIDKTLSASFSVIGTDLNSASTAAGVAADGPKFVIGLTKSFDL